MAQKTEISFEDLHGYIQGLAEGIFADGILFARRIYLADGDRLEDVEIEKVLKDGVVCKTNDSDGNTLIDVIPFGSITRISF